MSSSVVGPNLPSYCLPLNVQYLVSWRGEGKHELQHDAANKCTSEERQGRRARCGITALSPVPLRTRRCRRARRSSFRMHISGWRTAEPVMCSILDTSTTKIHIQYEFVVLCTRVNLHVWWYYA